MPLDPARDGNSARRVDHVGRSGTALAARTAEGPCGRSRTRNLWLSSSEQSVSGPVKLGCRCLSQGTCPLSRQSRLDPGVTQSKGLAVDSPPRRLPHGLMQALATRLVLASLL